MTVSSSWLRSPAVLALLDLALEEDLGRGDVTTAAIGLEGEAVGSVVAREPLVCAGLTLAELLVERAGCALEVRLAATDGAALDPGATLLELRGAAAPILQLERTLLNFLMRCCGVATLTRRYVDALGDAHTRLVDTRKTLPGWRVLDKHAVAAGGGHNHRFDLGSGVLIKDNHIAACGSLSAAVRRARLHAPHALRVEVEVDTLEQLDEAIAARADVVLLDNMTPEQVARAVERAGGRALLEVSGGVDLSSIRAYAEAGADIISVGALTHSAPAVDLSLELAAARAATPDTAGKTAGKSG